MRHLSYAAMLAFVLLGTAPLEVFLRVGVYRRVRRLVLTVLPVLAVFLVWDLYAIAAGHWTFDPAQTLRVLLPGGLPVEELAFFLVVPVASVLTLEAVRAVNGVGGLRGSDWVVGDE